MAEPYGQEKKGLVQDYFMMYGEVYDTGGDYEGSRRKRWWTRLIAVNIVIVNRVITGFNNID